MKNEPLDAIKYFQTFEQDPQGADILDELIRRFGMDHYVPGGLEAERQTIFNCGAKAVIDFIILRINQANGIDNDKNPTVKTDL